MSVLYLHFESDERAGRARTLGKSGAHVVVAAPRWPGFFELAKRERPYAIAVDFSMAPSHALETADYISKARETKEAALFLLRIPSERLEAVHKRLPQAQVVTENELSERLGDLEREAEQRAREKKEAAAAAKREAAQARKAARAALAKGAKPAPPAPAKAKPAAPAKKPAAPKKKLAQKAPAKKTRPKKKK